MSTLTFTLNKMTFEQGLIASGYHFQPHTGAFCKEDSNDNLHTYQEQEENVWLYVKLNVNDMIMTTNSTQTK